jgi:tRNA-specific 2-thiouridylase
MPERHKIIVALSGGVDSAVAAMLLRDAGHDVECLHMSNWDDGYCEAARDYQDARKAAQRLGLPLHRVNFADEYRKQVFERFLEEHRAGRTPNPDVLCNREIKFGAMRRYARRLGADRLATGHYARLRDVPGTRELLKGTDDTKDQSYFLHAVSASDFAGVLFPLGELKKTAVRSLARAANLPVAEKKDSTGICFIGERPFDAFLREYLPTQRGPIKEPGGRVVGEHDGLAFYTLGQRHGLKIGGLRGHAPGAWYVAAKDPGSNTLIAVQGANHPLLYQSGLMADGVCWINAPPPGWAHGKPLSCAAKTRYRQADVPCTVWRTAGDELTVQFEGPERAITPGQSVVFYHGDRCLGGATIRETRAPEAALEAAGSTAEAAVW